jgi:sulfoxide reductase heme-binding subunit YedZ
VVATALLPLANLALRAATDHLGADPVEDITHTTGDWALRLLLASLAITPLRRLLGLPALAPLRRSLGLLAFLYATLHALTYVGLDQGFHWEFLVEDVLERRYVTAGFAAWLCLLPLAATSTRRSMRRLGGARWTKLHRLIHVAAPLACVHYFWLVKTDLLPPLVYAAVLALLWLARLSLPGKDPVR